MIGRSRKTHKGLVFQKLIDFFTVGDQAEISSKTMEKVS